jgi:uncharacterized protein YecE (DUF72 family)
MGQLDLFGGGEVPARGEVATAPEATAYAELATRLPRGLHLGTSSWSFPGWRGIVWAGEHSEAQLARKGLAAYARHPLLRSVGLDRTHYAPVSADVLRAYAAAVPTSFRFLVKAHEACSLAVYPMHARYGEARGTVNPHFLDAAYARDLVVGPLLEGMGARAGVLLFQFAPQAIERLGGSPRAFAERLYRFLRDLPKGVQVAVEVRTPELLGPDYAAALRSAGAAHCVALLPGMPGADVQASMLDPTLPLVVRWLLAPGLAYDDAKSSFAPFDRVVRPDISARHAIAALVQAATARAVPATVIVNNKAEGSAPLSIAALAELIADAPPF